MTEHLIQCEGSGRDGSPTPLGTVACGMCGGQLLSPTLEMPTHHRHDRHHAERPEYLADDRIRKQYEPANNNSKDAA